MAMYGKMSQKIQVAVKEIAYRLVTYFKSFSGNEKAVIIAICFYTVILSFITSLRHYCFKTCAFDFGIFLQVFWHTLNGNFMFSKPIGTDLHPQTFLAVHVSPFLLLLLPIYALVRSPYTLLTIQSFALGLPALYVYRIALRATGREKLALIFAIGYLLHPATLWCNWYDFHLEAFIPLFLSITYYYYFIGRKKSFLISSILLIMVFEAAAFIVLSFVVYILARELYLKKRYGKNSCFVEGNLNRSFFILFGLAIISVIYFVMCENLMNKLWPERLVIEPAKIFGSITYDDVLFKLSYLFILCFPFAFLSLESPLELIPACPYLFIAICSNYKPYYTVNWQYPAIISIPLVVSAIFGLSQQKFSRKVCYKLLVFIILSLFLITPFSPLMAQFSNDWAIPLPDLEIQLKNQAISFLEENATVLAQENIFPHVAERKVAYVVWPDNLDPPDYIVVDVLSWRFYHVPSEKPIKDSLFEFIKRYNYGVFVIARGLIILKRDYQGPARILMPIHMSLDFRELQKSIIPFEHYFRETRFFVPEWVKVCGDHLFLGKNFTGSAWWGPYITVPPGKYRITVRFSVDRHVQGPLMRIMAYHWFPPPANPKVFAQKIIVGDNLIPEETYQTTVEFEIKNWESSLEIVGESYGKVNIKIYEVKFEQVE